MRKYIRELTSEERIRVKVEKGYAKLENVRDITMKDYSSVLGFNQNQSNNKYPEKALLCTRCKMIFEGDDVILVVKENDEECESWVCPMHRKNGEQCCQYLESINPGEIETKFRFKRKKEK